MIELKNDRLVFSFPEVHPSARLTIGFQRTLRIPDNDKDYPHPPILGNFPLRHVDDYATNIPTPWLKQGGVMLPMYQSEALWIDFTPHKDPEREAQYPFALKIATGKINVISGVNWTAELHRKPGQDYVVIPKQPRVDGYCVGKGIIRQFVAMPLGSGYSAEEQITSKAIFGGLQIQAFPMKRKAFEKRFPAVIHEPIGSASRAACDVPVLFARGMALASGGRIRQKIVEDPYGSEDWDSNINSRCFVHIANSMMWKAITGKNPPHLPPTAKSYAEEGMPWFDLYSDGIDSLEGSNVLSKLKSVFTLGKKKRQTPLPENESVSPEKIVALRKTMNRGQVREYTEV